jgi:3-phenylpropionate/cinnamic acid dioxygenase small subunit
MDEAAARHLVERFLFLEARLMDEHRYKDWLALWAEDGVYWVPCNDDDIDPARHVSIIYDDRERLQQRIERLMSGAVLAQEPKPRMRRVVSNIEIEGEGEEFSVQSNFVLALAKGDTQQLWAGRTIHRLRRAGDGFTIRHKKVLLINSDQEMPLLQFLI